jgi:hypothetical protein
MRMRTSRKRRRRKRRTEAFEDAIGEDETNTSDLSYEDPKREKKFLSQLIRKKNLVVSVRVFIVYFSSGVFRNAVKVTMIMTTMMMMVVMVNAVPSPRLTTAMKFRLLIQTRGRTLDTKVVLQIY